MYCGKIVTVKLKFYSSPVKHSSMFPMVEWYRNYKKLKKSVTYIVFIANGCIL